MIIGTTLANIIILLEIAERQFLRGTVDIRHQGGIINEATYLIRTYSSGYTESRFFADRAFIEQPEESHKTASTVPTSLPIAGSTVRIRKIVCWVSFASSGCQYGNGLHNMY